jgi:HD-like signal output (HDOD) protein/DNA-binding response OmpR family regulator
MSTILMIDSVTPWQGHLVEAIQRSGHIVITVSGVSAALRIIACDAPDLIVVDPSRTWDRYETLKSLSLAMAPRRAVILVISDPPSREEVMKTALLGVRDYLLKTGLTIDRIMERISRRLTPGMQHHGLCEHPTAPHGKGSSRILTAPEVASRPPLTSRDTVLDLIHRGLELRPIAPIVQRIMSLTCNADCCVDDVARCLSQDQIMSVRILRLANGSAYSRGRPVDSLKAAVARIGLREVRNLAATLSVVQQYEGQNSDCIDPRLFWEHSIACGLIASTVGAACDMKNSEEFFLWGMLHDLGRLVFLEHLHDEYVEAYKYAQDLGVPLELVESKLLAIDHCRVLETALKHWQFPPEFIQPIVNHHIAPSRLQRFLPQSARHAAIVGFADRLAHALLLGDSGSPVLYGFGEHAHFLGVDADTIERIVARIPEETNAIKFGMLAQSNQSEWPDYRLNIQKQMNTNIRPLIAGNNAFDPFRLFFGRIADASAEGPPNIAALYLEQPGMLECGIQQLRELEVAAGVEPLPTIVLLESADPQMKNLDLARPYTAFVQPVHLGTLIRECNNLLEHSTSGAGSSPSMSISNHLAEDALLSVG